MAVIKAALVVAVIGVLLWRFGLSTPQGVAVAYLIGIWLMAGATMLVWQLTLIPVAAVGFHVGELALLLVALRDYRAGPIRAVH